ncbi:hypothetical protein ABVK25_007229 [Lepraria finkii]|uniref:Uncharacterized protein n=1 Tax=Lepraria finkii TaxID=1340010 RepID=A0ABR4B370_9LECA
MLDEMKVEDMVMLDCMKWARKETAIMGLIQRLRSHKALLSLITKLLNRSTLAEAKDSVDRLYALIERCYQDMSSRVSSSRDARIAANARRIFDHAWRRRSVNSHNNRECLKARRYDRQRW